MPQDMDLSMLPRGLQWLSKCKDGPLGTWPGTWAGWGYGVVTAYVVKYSDVSVNGKLKIGKVYNSMCSCLDIFEPHGAPET